jgi:hypothetical protein
MDKSEFANGIQAIAGKKARLLWRAGLNQGLNMRDSA